MTKAAAFRQADLTRAIKAAVAAGQIVASAKIDKDGAIVVLFGDGAQSQRRNPLDRLLAND